MQACFVLWRWWKELRGEGLGELGVDGGESTKHEVKVPGGLSFLISACPRRSHSVK